MKDNMKDNSLDNLAAPYITRIEYEQLIRDSERLAMLRNYVQGDEYVYIGVIKKILGVEEKQYELIRD